MKNVLMIKKNYASIVVFCFLSYLGWSQDCSLDIGGGNPEVLNSIFQLNANQIAKLESLRGDYTTKAKALEEEMKTLLEKHPQSTPEELTNLAKKYKVLENNLLILSISTDKEFLQNLNQKQYNRYIELCTEAVRKPFVVKPLITLDSIPLQKN